LKWLETQKMLNTLKNSILPLIACSQITVAGVNQEAVPKEVDSGKRQEMLQLNFPDVKIISARRPAGVEDSDNIHGNSNNVRATAIRPPHCAIRGVIGKETNFEVLLPDRWNQKFFMGGGGGFVGSIQNSSASTIEQGYATAGTDTGHSGDVLHAEWALNNPERQLNFGYLAIHETAAVAKSIIAAYYGVAAKYSYFMGASRGGGQAMHEALRYPEDFDGIVAGSPAMDWTGFSASFLRDAQAVYPVPSDTTHPVITPANQKLLGARILAACDALDGVKDGIMEDPRECKFDLATIPWCKADHSGPDCFTSAQRKAILTIYSPLTNEDGTIYPGYPFGGEDEPGGWYLWITGSDGQPSFQYTFATEFFKYFVFSDPSWNYSHFTFANWKKRTQFLSAFMDAKSPDLTQLKAAGHKLIMWVGWEDLAQNPLRFIQYWESVKAKDPDVASYFRLFLLPGVTHSVDTPGPNKVDWPSSISDWVENGYAPQRVVASKLSKDGIVVRTRPLCAYPKRAAYSGNGDTNVETNFSCQGP
jgi:Tannase and feruloyl esterase